MTLSELLNLCAERNPTIADVEQLLANGDGTSNSLDRLALELASRYDAGLTEFREADAVANVLFAFAVERGLLGDLMEQVFLAFDAGEFVPPDSPVDFDPEAAYTRPRLAAIVQQARRIEA